MRQSRLERFLRRAEGRLQPGEESFRRAALLPTLYVFAALCLIYGILGFGYRIGSPFFPWDWLELCFVTALCAWFRRAGMTSLAAVSLLVVSSHAVSFIVARYGLQSPAPAMFLPTIALSGLIVGRRMVLLWGALCIGLIVWVGARLSPLAQAWPTMLGWSFAMALTVAIVDQFSLKLEEVLHAAVRAEEAERAAIVQERTRIARDLHDSLAQAFTGIMLHLRAAEIASQSRPEELHTHLRQAIDTAQEGLSLSKESVWSLRQEPDTNLRRMVEESAERLLTPASIRWSLDWKGPELDGSPELNAILREALVNILRHAKATTVSIGLSANGKSLQLAIADDGVGMRAREGLGIKGMRERAAALGARLEIESPPEGGCRLELTIDG